MITPSHIIYGWVAAKLTEREPDKRRTLAFVVGSFLPDIPVYVFFLIHGIILGTSQRVMWNELYFDSGWTPFFTLSHSLVLWPLLLLAGTYMKKNVIRYIASAAILHVCLDFLVHNDDAYAHFWPVTDWKFMSPVSYWDPNYYGNLIGTIDSVIILGILVWLSARYQQRQARIGICIIAVLYIASLVLPAILF